jgi:hypothetical protein
MSNRASDQLHRLIKSLSKPEKRYFKVFSSRHVIGDKNNYQVLFDAIGAQEEYSEEKILKKFQKEAFTKRFSIAKSRLYTAILKSLDSYHANSSIEAQIKRDIHCAEILYKKGLYDQSAKLLRSIKKVAEKHEKITSLIEISKWEKQLIEKDNYQGVSKNELNDILEKDARLSRSLSTYDNYWNIKSRIFEALFKSGKARSQKELTQFKDIIDEVVVTHSEEDMTAENAFLLNHLYSAYHYGAGDYKNSFPYIDKSKTLIEENPHLFKEEPNIYLSVISNLMYVGMQLEKFTEVEGYLNKLNELPKELMESATDNQAMRIFVLEMSSRLTLHTIKEEYDKGIGLIPEIEDGIIKYGDKLSAVRRSFFYFNIAVLYFWKGEMNTALKWINQLLNNIDIDDTQDIHCMAQIFYLIIHLELGNKSLLPYSLRSTKRYLETRNRVYKFEKVLLDFVNEQLKKRQNKTDAELFSELSTELEVLSKDSFEKPVFEYFNFLKWAKNRAQVEV